MSRTFTGTYTTTQYLTTAGDNPAFVTSAGTIAVDSSVPGAGGLVGNAGYAWTVNNSGVIESTGSQGVGVELRTGGQIVNQPLSGPGGYIAGSFAGIEITGAAGDSGTVVNYGTVRANSTGGFNHGIYFYRVTGTVGNSGTIIANDVNGNGTAINLGQGGSVSNYGLIEAFGGASNVGIGAFSAVATVSNNGTIIASGGTSATAISIQSGTIANNGLLSGDNGISLGAGGSSVVNFGTVQSTGTGTFSTAVNLQTGGTITLRNQGTIVASGTGGFAVNLNGAATVVNGSVRTTSALIAGYRSAVNAVAATVVNYGTIMGTGPGSLSNAMLLGSGSLSNRGLIQSSGNGVTTGAGTTITNTGTIASDGTNGIAVIFGAGGGELVNGMSGSGVGLITAYHTGIGFFPGTAANPGTVDIINYGRIVSTQPGTAAGTGFSGFGVQFGNGGTGTVQNFGTISSAESAGGGGAILLQSGGTVINGNANDPGALIEGNYAGIQINGSAGTVTNFGTIVSYASAVPNGIALYLTQGGSITNYGLIEGNRQPRATGGGKYGAAIIVHGPNLSGNVTNFGTIRNTNPGDGLNLDTGGTLINGSTAFTAATIAGSVDAVLMGQTAGTATVGAQAFVFNYGTIAAVGTGAGFAALAGGTVTNFGTISESDGNAVLFTNTVGTVFNFGAVLNTSTTTAAARLAAGGVVVNYGAISSNRTGISINTLPGTVSNFGTVLSNVPVTGTAGSGVYLQSGGIVTNQRGALIAGYRSGVDIEGSAGTLTNFGTIAHLGSGTGGDAVALTAGGIVTNYGTITGGHVATYGTPNSFGAALQFSGVAGTAVNFGQITASQTNADGVHLLAGGTLVNGSTAVTDATISVGRLAVYIGGTFGTPTSGAAGFVFNYGTIENTASTAPAVDLASGGSVINHGLISSAARTGVSLTGGGTIDNFGSIVSTAPASGTVGTGVYFGQGGLVTNEVGGVISAVRGAVALAFNGTTNAAATISNSGNLTGSVGISIGKGDTGANTIVNFGTITGTNGTAVSLGSGNDLLVIEAGSALQGVITNVHIGDVIDLPFIQYSNVGFTVIDSNHTLSVVQNSTTFTIALDPNQNLVPDAFLPTKDSNGATAVEIVHSGIFAGTYTTGIVLSIPAAQNPATITGTGYVTNTDAASYGGDAVYGLSGVPWRLTNIGTVQDTLAAGVFLASGGTVTNGVGLGASALITGYTAGVQIAGVAGTVLNRGTIEASGISGAGVLLNLGGSLNNAGRIAGVAFGAELTAAGTVTNTGIIDATGTSGTGLYLTTGGFVDNSGAIIGTNFGAYFREPTEIVNSGAISGNTAIDITLSGTLTNTGDIFGVATGIYMPGGGVVTNYGSVVASASNGVAVNMADGGSFDNAAQTGGLTGFIAGGHYGVSLGGANQTVVNAGTIEGGDDAVIMRGAGPSVINQGVISGTNASSAGVYLIGGEVTNASTGTIVGDGVGVDIGQARGTAINAGTIVGSGASGTGVAMGDGGYLYNAVTGRITGGGAGAVIAGAAGTVVNQGTIGATGTAGVGLQLNSGGYVDNQGAIYADPLRGAGIVLSIAADILNSGRIIGNNALQMSQGDTATNNGSIIGDAHGIYLAGAGSVINSGVIRGAAASGVAVDFANGGNLTNNGGTAPGYIYGGQLGIEIGGAGGTVLNAGTVIGGDNAILIANATAAVFNYGLISGSGTYADGVYLTGGSVTNASTATIEGSAIGVHIGQTTGIVVNYGTIAGTGQTNAAGAVLSEGGTLDNAGTGLLTGGQYGAVIAGAVGTVVNLGTIEATGARGVGLRILSGTINNQGDIQGVAAGVKLDTPAIVTNSGHIAGDYAIDLTHGGDVVNTGAIIGVTDGIYASGSGTVLNSASILASDSLGIGINLTGGGGITNNAGGVIEGGHAGVSFGGVDGTLVNHGTVTGIYAGVNGSGTTATIVNYGALSAFGANADAVYLTGGTVVNSVGATLTAPSFGVKIETRSGFVANSGTIIGSGTAGVGVSLYTGSTLTNAGSIIGGGGVAVTLGTDSTVIVDPGAVFSGIVSGFVDVGPGTGDLVLAAGAATGTISGIGSSFTGFGTITVETGASWQFAGNNAVGSGGTLALAGNATLGLGGTLTNSGAVDIGPNALLDIDNGATVSGGGNIAFLGNGGELQVDGTAMPSTAITGFAQGDSIDLPNIAADSIGYAGGVVTLANKNVTVAQLNVATIYGAPAFSEQRDSTGGTLITVSPPVLPIYTFITDFNKTNSIQHSLIKEFPSGIVTGNQGLSVPFDVVSDGSGNNFSEITTSLTINVSIANVAHVHTLIAAYMPPDGATAATVEFIGTGGADETFTLVNGNQLRDFFDDGFANSINGTTAQNMFTVTGVQDAAGTGDVTTGNTGTYRMDEQDFVLNGSFAGQTLQQIVITNLDGPGETPILLGVTAQSAITGQVVSSGGTLIVSSGQAYEAVTVQSGGTLIVLSGGFTGDTVDSGTEILSGGIEFGAAVDSGATLTVSAGGTVSAATVNSGGVLTISAGGAASGTTVGVFGVEHVSGGGVASNTLVVGGGSEIIDAGATEAGGTVGGGIIDVLGTAQAILISGGSVIVETGGSAADATINSGTLALLTGASASGTTTFAGSGGLILVEASTPPANAIAGMASGDAIDLRALGWSTANTAQLNGTTLTVTGTGGAVDTLTLIDVAAHTDFVTADDGNGGTLVEAQALPANIFNGTYTNGIVLSNPVLQNPAVLTSTAQVSIGGSSYNRAVYGESVAAWTVTNYGTVTGAGSDSTGIGLQGGGTIINGAPGVTNALVTGSHNGVAIEGTPGVIDNFGTIESTSTVGGIGVHLRLGGTVQNGQNGATAALIDATRGAIYIGGNYGSHYTGAAGTVINFGTIIGSENDVIALVASGTVTNDGTIVGVGTATGGVFLEPGGLVTNRGLIIGSDRGVYVYGGLGTVANLGTIVSTNDNAASVGLAAGGRVTNGAPGAASGLIVGYRVGVFGGTSGSPTVLTNYGTVATTATGTAGGPVSFGVLLNAAGTVANFGTIAAPQAAGGGNAGGDGVALIAGGVVTNGAGGSSGPLTTGAVISGGAYGVLVDGGVGEITNFGTISGAAGVVIGGAASGGTIVNYGTIIGAAGTAVAFGGGPDVLVIEPGSVLQGAIAGLGIGDTLDLRGLAGGAAGSVLLGAGNLLTVTEAAGKATLQLDPAQDFSSSTFSLSDDGQGGTDIVENVFGTVGPGQTLVVSAGVTLTGITVLSGGTLEVLSGGAVISSLIEGGGRDLIGSGGLDISATIERGGVQDVSGTASATLLVGGGAETVAAGGVASGTMVSNGSRESVQSGGTTIDTTVFGGGLLDVQAGAAAPGTIKFSGIGGELEIDGSVMPTAVLSGFDRGDILDLHTLPPGAATAMFDRSTGALTVSGGGVSDTLVLAGGVSPGTAFALSNDGQGGTLVVAGPPAPGNLALQASSDSGVLHDGVTNVTEPLVLGSGEVGDTVTLYDGSAAVGSGTVDGNGSWAAQAHIVADGIHQLTARETDAAGNVSGPSAVFALDLDLAPPIAAAPSTLAVLPSSSKTPLGIAAPSDADDSPSGLSIRVDAVPSNGTVMLADGTPVGVFSSLTVAQLTGLVFTPGANQIGTSGNFAYTVFDLAGSLSAGSETVSVVLASAPSVYDFLFTYGNGQDYYYGTVSDDGTYGYQVGQTVNAGLGTYQIFNMQSLSTEPVGSVSVADYTHTGPGQASVTPVATAAGRADGSNGLGSESDAVPGTDGQNHPFSPTMAASFGSTTALFGFTYTYADASAFYTGTVASDGTVTAGSRTVTNSAGQVLGTYTVFADGVTARAAGSVVIDRFTTGDAAFLPVHATAGSVDGSKGLGSEQGSIVVNGMTVGFGASQEPALSVIIQPVVVVPNNADVVTAELTEVFQEILDRSPTGNDLATYSGQIAAGTSLASIRQTLAQSSEAQTDLNQLYHQIFDRDADPGGLATYTDALIDGSSLTVVQLLLAQSPEAQSDLNQLYEDVLGRPIDGGGQVTYMAALATGTDIDGVRRVVAQSPESVTNLTQLFQTVTGRAPDAAELQGMVDQLAGGTATQQALQSGLAANGTAGGYLPVTAGPGNAVFTAVPGTPTEFVFGDVAFGTETIAGFDPLRDAIAVSHNLTADLATLKNDAATTPSGTLITLNQTQSITLNGIPTAALNDSNFRVI
ncbi:MAG TPA: Ig-like domain-containing protein [Stellaceae bacterium]|jgi:hypothetical protein|nr:Ig-like domain-containing protein [Stellaceae bacterium]